MRKAKNILIISIIIACTILPTTFAEDINTTTKDGRAVILHDNGTWEFIKETPEQREIEPISIEDFDKIHLPENPDISRYVNSVRLTLMIKNNTDKLIKAWRATLAVENPFGDILFRIQLTDGTANIKPRQIEKANFDWEDNMFITDEPYDQLLSFDKGNLKLKLSEIKIVH
ncbi:MAG: hypothetical protein HON76_22160 [Candidatus Scalindua sp.]|jgi:hypothetical protein|nr:hypothetical protein [Candidatus Scalindua sp.]MBT6225532.1 hypothetical protein [Candidatus Scalindua sp.]MBT6565219.1 hypothetical protein [Candidatus Scalindua sp.]MBT7210309.1 hypothetical protein [Candidatus Scalindua sp.]